MLACKYAGGKNGKMKGDWLMANGRFTTLHTHAFGTKRNFKRHRKFACAVVFYVLE